MKTGITRGIALAPLLMFVSALWAADGVTEINQASVEAAGGFPYVISEPGSYTLSGNLTVPDENTNAIEVEAPDVTVDLNGFAIIGPVKCLSFNTRGNGTVSCSQREPASASWLHQRFPRSYVTELYGEWVLRESSLLSAMWKASERWKMETAGSFSSSLGSSGIALWN